ncbi:hypothetical protein L596_010548 [Steinernema carpocapsae]|nr:hypothetical protein L596_010548 [Steinernema carpocapsae]
MNKNEPTAPPDCEHLSEMRFSCLKAHYNLNGFYSDFDDTTVFLMSYNSSLAQIWDFCRFLVRPFFVLS